MRTILIGGPLHGQERDLDPAGAPHSELDENNAPHTYYAKASLVERGVLGSSTNVHFRRHELLSEGEAVNLIEAWWSNQEPQATPEKLQPLQLSINANRNIDERPEHLVNNTGYILEQAIEAPPGCVNGDKKNCPDYKVLKAQERCKVQGCREYRPANGM